jgi:hypothetical protein
MSASTTKSGTGKDTETKTQTQTQPQPQPQIPTQSINFALKAKYAAYTTLIFFLIANPETYKLLQKFVGSWVTIASEGGCPTPTGFFIHAGLFFLVLWSFMLMP